MNDKKYLKIIRHYEQCLAAHGDTHRGVDWPNEEDAKTRYKIMLELIREKTGTMSLLDFGCGASHLYEYMMNHNIHNIRYTGLDLSEKFISLSQNKYPSNEYICADVLKMRWTEKKYDYIILNGVLTEKQSLSFDEMFDHFKELVAELFQYCMKGLAFNVMSKQVDWERDDLFHLSLDTMAGFITKHLTRNYIIRNDYGLYEYTVYLYKEKYS